MELLRVARGVCSAPQHNIKSQTCNKAVVQITRALIVPAYLPVSPHNDSMYDRKQYPRTPQTLCDLIYIETFGPAFMCRLEHGVDACLLAASPMCFCVSRPTHPGDGVRDGTARIYIHIPLYI